MSVCVKCFKDIAAESAFCNWCGADRPMSANSGRARIEAGLSKKGGTLVLIFIGLVASGLLLWVLSPHGAYTNADEAIEAAARACGAGSHTVLAERIVEAEQDIRALPAADQGTYQVKLHNRLKFVLCE